jgi:hypothetical protein
MKFSALRSIKCIFLTLILFAIYISSAVADTYTVTSTSLTGPGSFLEAVEMANNNPGQDVIEFTPGLQVDAAGDNYVSLNDYVIANIKESVVIDGNGGALNGRKSWATKSGVVNQLSGCPRAKDGTLILAVTPGFLSIGKPNQDNSDIEVTVKNLTIKQFNQVASVKKNAALVLENFMAIQTWATFKCQGDALIEVDEGASLTILKSELNGYYNWKDFGVASVIVGVDAGDLTIEETLFNRMEDGDNYLINWIGQPGSVVNIVSSRMRWSGGISIAGEVSQTNIVNSIWTTYYLKEPDYADRFRNVSTGDMNFIASTLVWNNYQCNGLCQSVPSYALIERLGSGKINFKGTAISFNFNVTPGEPLISTLGDAGTDGFTADQYTWIQPTEAQDADALKTITGQPALRTVLPAFNHPLVINTTENWDVELATPAFPGQLIDVIPVTQVLINPITNSFLTVDVVGNDRVDANGYRDIGALQLGLAPNLLVSGTGDGYVDLKWNEPLHHDGLDITGYEARYFETGSPGSPTTVTGISDKAVAINGLSNGTDYTFEVRAIYAGPEEGPWSNQVTATPYGALGTPAVTATPGDGQVELSWTLPDLGGREFIAYTILWREAGSTEYIDALAFYNPGETTTTITGLKNGTTYEFAVTVNATGAFSEKGTATATPHGDIGTVDRSPDESLPATRDANKPRYWENGGYGDNCIKYEVEDDFGSVWEIMSGEYPSALILKSGQINDVWIAPEPGYYGTASAKYISHAIVCYDE